MACEVKTQDVQKHILNSLTAKYETARPINSGSTVFIPNSSKNYNINKIESEVDILNSQFGSEFYGDVVHMEIRDTGIAIRISPTQELLDAMTYQNIIDEASNEVAQFREVQFSQESQELDFVAEGDMFSSPRNNQNIQRPVTDNFIEYIRFKETLLKKVRDTKANLNRDRYNPTKDPKKVLGELQNIIKIEAELAKELSEIKESSVEYMFKPILDDIQALRESLDKATDVEGIRDKINFYNKLILGKEYDSNDSFDIEPLSKLKTDIHYSELDHAINTLNREYSEKLDDLAMSIIENNILYQNNIAGNEKLTPEDFESMFNPDKDINWIEKNFLGINSTSENDGIIPQIIASNLQAKITKRESEVKSYMDRLNFLIDKIKKEGGGFDFIFELDEYGRQTGNIISSYTPKYRTALNKFYRIGKEDTNKTPYNAYTEKINWLKKNAEVIDFRKLPEIQELYGDIYEEHFKFSPEEMSEYQTNLKQLLGVQYEEEITKLKRNLESFQVEKSTLEEDSTVEFKNKKIAISDPWAFINHYYSSSAITKLSYRPEVGQNTETVVPSMAHISFVPKKENYIKSDISGKREYASTGFYNRTFESTVATNNNNLEYWKLIKEVYTEYINPTYNDNIQDMSYAKMRESWVEAIYGTKGLAKGTVFVREMSTAFRDWFYEVGEDNQRDGIVSNYGDKSKREINSLIENYLLLNENDFAKLAHENDISYIPKIDEGLTFEDRTNKESIARTIATEKILSNYSKDINKVTGALLNMAAAMKAKQDVAPSARLLADAHRAKGRKNSSEKLDSFIERVIYNKNEKYRGTTSFLGKDLSKNSLLGMAFDKLGQIPFLRDKISAYSLRNLNPSEKILLESIQQLQNGDTNTNLASFNVKGEDNNVITYYISNEIAYKASENPDTGAQDISEISRDIYDKALQDYLEAKVEELGLDLSLAGMIQGILKLIIFKGLGLNPISGIFNRMEGKNSGIVMDITGQYWTPGNITIANNFMSLANLMNLAGDKVPPNFRAKKLELDKLKAFLQSTDLIQDRKNELERANTQSKFDIEEHTNIFKWAVDNPEFKNQGAILLSILMDTYITDNEGNSVPMFDGSSFTAWDLVDGKLVLKEQFRNSKTGESNNLDNWENFKVDEDNAKNNQFFLTKMKMKNAISSSQGNYEKYDTIMATKNIWGRMLTLFMKWFYEHARQRYSSGKGVDLINAQRNVQQIKGRYRYVWENKPAFVGAATLSAFTLFGLTPVTLFAAGAGISGVVAHQFFKKYSSNERIKQESLGVMELIAFTKSVVVGTLNYPLELVNSKRLLKDTTLDNLIPGYEKGTNLSEQEIQNLQAVAKEIGIRLSYISLMLLIKSLTWDDDDDKDSTKRQFHNFMDNQLGRVIDSIANWSSPMDLYDDVSRFAFVSYLNDASKLLKSLITFNEDGKLGEQLLKASPLPRILYKGTMPFLDEKQYNKGGWIDKAVKGNGPKAFYEDYRKKEKERITKEVESSGYKGDEADYLIKSRMRNEVASKGSSNTYKEIRDKLKKGISAQEINKENRVNSSNKSKDRKLNIKPEDLPKRGGDNR